MLQTSPMNCTRELSLRSTSPSSCPTLIKLMSTHSELPVCSIRHNRFTINTLSALPSRGSGRQTAVTVPVTRSDDPITCRSNCSSFKSATRPEFIPIWRELRPFPQKAFVRPLVSPQILAKDNTDKCRLTGVLEVACLGPKMPSVGVLVVVALATFAAWASGLKLLGKPLRHSSARSQQRGSAGLYMTIPLQEVKNMRDIQTASPRINIQPSKVFRTGCVSKASPADVRADYCRLYPLALLSAYALSNPLPFPHQSRPLVDLHRRQPQGQVFD